MTAFCVLAGACIVADAYMLVNGYEPWFFSWKKKKETKETEDKG